MVFTFVMTAFQVVSGSPTSKTAQPAGIVVLAGSKVNSKPFQPVPACGTWLAEPRKYTVCGPLLSMSVHSRSKANCVLSVMRSTPTECTPRARQSPANGPGSVLWSCGAKVSRLVTCSQLVGLPPVACTVELAPKVQ